MHGLDLHRTGSFDAVFVIWDVYGGSDRVVVDVKSGTCGDVRGFSPSKYLIFLSDCVFFYEFLSCRASVDKFHREKTCRSDLVPNLEPL